VPIGKFQSGVLRVLAAQRSPDSYIAGGVAINREGPRFSGDIDIFHGRRKAGAAGRERARQVPVEPRRAARLLVVVARNLTSYARTVRQA
jgi:hypothetical protein